MLAELVSACYTCTQSFDTCQQLAAHLALHHSVLRFSCALCPTAPKTLAAAAAHRVLAHGHFRCRRCAAVVEARAGHRCGETAARFRCDAAECRDEFPRLNAFVRHLAERHRIEATETVLAAIGRCARDFDLGAIEGVKPVLGNSPTRSATTRPISTPTREGGRPAKHEWANDSLSVSRREAPRARSAGKLCERTEPLRPMRENPPRVVPSSTAEQLSARGFALFQRSLSGRPIFAVHRHARRVADPEAFPPTAFANAARLSVRPPTAPAELFGQMTEKQWRASRYAALLGRLGEQRERGRQRALWRLRLQCSNCARPFADAGQLAAHQRTCLYAAVQSLQRMGCPLCPRSFAQNEALVEHLALEHFVG